MVRDGVLFAKTPQLFPKKYSQNLRLQTPEKVQIDLSETEEKKQDYLIQRSKESLTTKMFL